MDVIIPDSWLREFVKTNATAQEITKYLSLCGPSVEKTTKDGKETLYLIEVTANRVDSAGVEGIAREASAILPRFGIKAQFVPLNVKSKQKFVRKVNYLDFKIDHSLAPRATAVLVKNVKIGESPKWMKIRLTQVGLRSINNVIDISNYVMHELAQPLHTFDYDKISKKTMILRQSKKGEKITTLDNIEYDLPGNDIVIADGSRRLIDLAGIMGGQNSMINKNTKNVLLFVQTYNPFYIRKTSMFLAKRSEASNLFEKGLDPEKVELATRRAIDLLEQLTGGKAEKMVLDLYPKPYKTKSVQTTSDFINQKLGTKVSKSQISKILSSLKFGVAWNKNNLKVTIPSWRAQDVEIEEDIVEEIARIYGYHNIPSLPLAGILPEKIEDAPFAFETKIKNLLKALGADEIYTLSLVPEEYGSKGLKLKNPLGKDSEYLRTTLLHSLVKAAEQNSGYKEPFHLFEMANVYLPQSNNLPKEEMKLSGIFAGFEYQDAKGVLETLLEKLNIKNLKQVQADESDFLPEQLILFKAGEEMLGKFGNLEKENLAYYEFDVQKLQKHSNSTRSFKPIPKYPAQIEDLTLILPKRTKIGELIEYILAIDKTIKEAELSDIYKNAYTFRISYQNSRKTLEDKEVEKIRKRIIEKVKKRFGAIEK